MQERIARRRAHRGLPPSRAPLLALALLSGMGTASAVEVRAEADYLAIVIEAEAADQKNDRWVLTEPDTPALSEEEDPDGNHSDQAVGKAYLELLPDTRVRHEDELIQNENFWGFPGAGPEASWNVDFPMAGRYYVHVRALSTGTEDNGLFLGLNGAWPASGQRLQLCGAGAGWLWTSRQRYSGGVGPCGIEKTIWLDVPSAGEHVVQVSAREDGFELDRLMLIHDLSDNTRICSPSGEDAIACRDGSIENADGAADVSLAMSADVDTARLGDEVLFTFDVTNEDKFDPALDVTLQLTFDTGSDWEFVRADERCETSEEGLLCTLGELAETAEQKTTSVEIALRVGADELLQVAAQVASSSEDLITDNDSAFLIIDAVPPPVPVELGIEMSGASAVETGAVTQLTVRVDNVSAVLADDVLLTLTVSGPVTLQTLPAMCQLGGEGLSCNLGTVVAGQGEEVSVQARGDAAGTASIAALATVSNDSTVQARSIREIVVNDPVVEEQTPDLVDVPEPVIMPTPEPESSSEPDSGSEVDPEPIDPKEGAEQAKRGGSGSSSLLLLLLLAGVRRGRVKLGAGGSPNSSLE